MRKSEDSSCFSTGLV